jgi:hypothetical protein
MTRVAGATDHENACHYPLEHWPMGESEMRRIGGSTDGASAQEAAPAASFD